MSLLHSSFRIRSRSVAFGLPAALSLLAGTAFAHHGWSWYGNDAFELTGRVVETHFGNPHDRLVVEADGNMWNVMLSPPRRSQRAGFDARAVKVGDVITAYGHRHEDRGNFEMKTERIVVGESTYDLYPDRL